MILTRILTASTGLLLLTTLALVGQVGCQKGKLEKEREKHAEALAVASLRVQELNKALGVIQDQNEAIAAQNASIAEWKAAGDRYLARLDERLATQPEPIYVDRVIERPLPAEPVEAIHAAFDMLGEGPP